MKKYHVHFTQSYGLFETVSAVSKEDAEEIVIERNEGDISINLVEEVESKEEVS